MLEKFGKYKLSNIKYFAIQKYFSDRYSESTESLNTTDHAQHLLGQIFRAAVSLGYLGESPMDAYKKPNLRANPPKVVKNGQVRDVISDEILADIYERFPKGTHHYLILKIAELTGMRRNEIMGLAFEDIDWDNRLIYLSRQVMVLDRDAEMFPYEKDVVSQYPMLDGLRYVARDPKYDSK
jgi:integrase